MRSLFILFVLFFCSQGLFSQIDEDSGLLDTTQVNLDSIDYDSYTKKTNAFKTLFAGPPGKAALYGLVIPSGGQIYNQRYLKVPVVLAADATAVYFFYVNRQSYVDYRDAYAEFLNGEITSFRNIYTANGIKVYRDYYRDNYELAGIAVVAIHLLSVVEAYVDRHLMDFDIDESLSFHIDSQPNSGVQLGLKYNFN